MRSGASCSARGRGCYVEIVSGDPFEVDFDDFGVIFGPVAFPAALALFFREKGDLAWPHCGLATVSLSGNHTARVCGRGGRAGRGTRKV